MTILQTASKAFSDHVYGVDHVLFFRLDIRTRPRLKRTASRMGTVRIGATLEEIAPLATAFPERMKYFLSYIEQGMQVFFFDIEGKVVAYTWVATQDVYDKFLWKYLFRVSPGEFFHFTWIRDPQAPRQPGALIVIQHMLEHFREREFIHAKTTISSTNEPSYRFCRKMGYQQTDEAVDVRELFNHRWSRETTPRVLVP